MPRLPNPFQFLLVFCAGDSGVVAEACGGACLGCGCGFVGVCCCDCCGGRLGDAEDDLDFDTTVYWNSAKSIEFMICCCAAEVSTMGVIGGGMSCWG